MATYDQTHRVCPLLFLTVIVSKGQGAAIAEMIKKAGAYSVYFVSGKGTAPNDMYAILGTGTLKKDVLCSVIRENAWFDLKIALQERFAISPLSKGLAFITRLDSVAGVSTYKMLSNTMDEEGRKKQKKRRKTHE